MNFEKKIRQDIQRLVHDERRFLLEFWRRMKHHHRKAPVPCSIKITA